ncbi:MAG: alpha/beta hydrolase [Spirochaetes bacterium]|nr:alpha/beta hydrolase [Spirochaetota bacterium]
MRKPTEGRASILGYRAHYLHYTAVKPKATLVCFHGWLDNAASFTALANALEGYEIYAWDFLGHGKSAHKHAGERYHFIDLVPFVEAALAHIAGDKKILVGHSMGAGAAALYAGAFSETIDRLVLIEGFSPITAPETDAAKILGEGVRGLKKAIALKKPRYARLDEAVAVRERINHLSYEAALPLVQRAVIKKAGAYTWRADFRLRAPSLMRLSDAQVKTILAAIAVPTLIVLGDQGMPELKKIAASNRTTFTKAQFVTLAGHHHLHMEKQSGVAEHIQKFIEG